MTPAHLPAPRPAASPAGTVTAPANPPERSASGVAAGPVMPSQRGPAHPLPGVALASLPPAGSTWEQLRIRETSWLADQRALLADLCDGTGDAAALGSLVDALTSRRLPGEPTPTPLIALIGVAFGDLVVRRVPGTGWSVLRDGPTNELALTHATHPLAIRPLAEVESAWNAGPGWFVPATARAVQRARVLISGEAVPA